MEKGNEFVNSEQYGFEDCVKIIPRFSEQFKSFIVPERFYTRILCHTLSHYLDNNHFFEPPVFLVVEGNAGEGKTSQAIASCTQKGINVLYVSSSSLSGSHESDSKNKLEKIYNKAVQLKKQGNLIVIIIDDFHKSIAIENANITRTVNTNLLVGYMMNLAENTGETQVPIILTANDTSDIYAPLLRFGRADIFKWEPKPKEKKETIESILSTFVDFSSEKEFDKFFDANQNESIAFFSQLKNKYRISVFEKIIKQIDSFDYSTLNSINSSISSSMEKIEIKELNLLVQRQRMERK